MLKEKRQQKIKTLINSRNIGSQSDLTALLSKAGFAVNQSSVSRDLDELGVIKTQGFYALPKKASTAQSFGLVSLETAGESLVVGLLGRQPARGLGEGGREGGHRARVPI